LAPDVLFRPRRSETVKNQDHQTSEHGVLETTAQAIGSTLGNLALKTGIAKPPAPVETREPVVASHPGHQHDNRKTRRAKKKK
jgi:hypothetical protein